MHSNELKVTVYSHHGEPGVISRIFFTIKVRAFADNCHPRSTYPLDILKDRSSDRNGNSMITKFR